METVLAYLIVIPLVQLAFSMGSAAAAPVCLAVCWMPKKARCILGGLLTGVACGLAAIGFGWAVFRYVAGQSRLGILPLAATVLPLYLPMRKDSLKYRELREFEEGVSAEVKRAIGPAAPYSLFLVIGEIVGLIAGACWTQF